MHNYGNFAEFVMSAKRLFNLLETCET